MELDRLHRGVPGRLDLLVALDDHLAALRVVARVGLGDDRVEEIAPRVDELGTRRRVLLVALADGKEVGPRLPHVPELGRSRGQARLLEQVLPVADSEAPDVGAEADHRVVVCNGLVPLPGRVARLQSLGPVVTQVNEVARLNRVVRDEADFDRLDVVGSRARGEMLGERRVVRRIVLGVFLDRDSGMRRLVLLVEVVVPEVAEDVDRECDAAALRGRGALDRQAGHRCEDRNDCSDEDETAPPLEDALHASPPCDRSAMGSRVMVVAPTASLVHPHDARTMSSTGSVNAAGVESGFSICCKRARAAA